VTVSRLYWFFCRLHEFLRTALVPVGAAPGAYRIVGISWGPAEGRIKNLRDLQELVQPGGRPRTAGL